jgi:hypothetical protein
LGERGFDAIAEVNVHTRAGVSFLFHRNKRARKGNTKRPRNATTERNGHKEGLNNEGTKKRR